jgi:hypothetical protein
MADEVALGGGYVNDVVRVGDTVRRRVREPRPFAQELLKFFEQRDWRGAPRFVGFDSEGREMLSWIEGHVPWVGVNEPPSVWDENAVASVAGLTRQFHDLTASTALAGDAEVVCHNDLSPRNTVYRRADAGTSESDGYRPVAFIDWDTASPGRRIPRPGTRLLAMGGRRHLATRHKYEVDQDRCQRLRLLVVRPSGTRRHDPVVPRPVLARHPSQDRRRGLIDAEVEGSGRGGGGSRRLGMDDATQRRT